MVKITEYQDKQGEQRKSIKFSGLGEEEEATFTPNNDTVWKSEKTYNTKDGGRTFRPHGIGATYNKDGVDHDVWVNLTETQAKGLQKLEPLKDKKIVAYKTKSKFDRLYVAFKVAGETKASTTNNQKLLEEYTQYEIDLAIECKEAQLNEDWTLRNFKNHKMDLKADIKDLDPERILKLIREV